MRLVAVIDEAAKISYIFKHLRLWEPILENPISSPEPPWPANNNIPLTYHSVPNSA